jgi:hypothetical protein
LIKDKLQKIESDSTKEKVQYALGFGVVGMLLMVTTGSILLTFILGVFSYFLWKTVSDKPTDSVKEIFEFYLKANDILRDDERKWFGFEIQDAIWRGEKILQLMPDPPPLVNFALGSLYHKIENHKAAVYHLSYIVESQESDEKNRSLASPELRNYVQTLRKIEQNPAEAPLMSAATRSLERARRNRAISILEDSRKKVWLLEEKAKDELNAKSEDKAILQSVEKNAYQNAEYTQNQQPQSVTDTTDFISPKPEEVIKEKPKRKKKTDPFNNHTPISEVLQDIYGK